MSMQQGICFQKSSSACNCSHLRTSENLATSFRCLSGRWVLLKIGPSICGRIRNGRQSFSTNLSIEWSHTTQAGIVVSSVASRWQGGPIASHAHFASFTCILTSFPSPPTFVCFLHLLHLVINPDYELSRPGTVSMLLVHTVHSTMGPSLTGASNFYAI